MPVLTNVPGFEFWVCIVRSGQVGFGSGQVRFRRISPPDRKQDRRGAEKKKNQIGTTKERQWISTET